VFVAGVGLVLVPLAFLLFSDLGSGVRAEPVWSVLTQPHLLSMFLKSVALALGVAAGSLLLGVPLGFLFAASRKRLIRVLFLLHVLPLSLPPYINGLGWAEIMGHRGLLSRLFGEGVGSWSSGFLYDEAGFLLVMIVSLSPVVSLCTWAFARGIDPSRLEAARLCRSPRAVWFRVALPLAAPGIALGGLLVFVLTLGEVAVAQLLRIPVYATVVFSRLADLSFLPGEALARALPLLAVAVAVAAACHWLDRGGRGALGLRADAEAVLPRGGVARAGMVMLMAALVLAVLPLGLLLFSGCFAAGGGLAAMGSALDSLGNSLVYASAGASCMLIIAAPAGYLWSRNPKLGAYAAFPALVGLVLPATVLALGLVIEWNRPATQGIYQGVGIVLLGLLARYLYLPMRAAKLGFDRMQKSWLDSARIHGSSWPLRFFKVHLPIGLPVLAAAWILAFLLSLRDLETIIVFYPPGGESLPVRALTLEANAPAGLTAATASVQVLVTAAVLLLLALVPRLKRTWR